MSINESDFDFESINDKALERLRGGESLSGKNGAFTIYVLHNFFFRDQITRKIVSTKNSN